MAVIVCVHCGSRTSDQEPACVSCGQAPFPEGRVAGLRAVAGNAARGDAEKGVNGRRESIVPYLSVLAGVVVLLTVLHSCGVIGDADVRNGIEQSRNDRVGSDSRGTVAAPASPAGVKVQSAAKPSYCASDLASVRRKVGSLLKKRKAMYYLLGEGTSAPSLCFVVLRKDWKSFNARQRAALRVLIGEKIVDLNAHPAKYTGCREGAPLWDYVLGNIGNTVPAVMLADRKVADLGEELHDFDSPKAGAQPKPPSVAPEATGSLDDQLMSAISNGDRSAVRRLLKRGASPNGSWSTNGMPALASAAVGGDLRIVKLLVERGADVNAADSTFGWTALEFARNELKNAKQFGDTDPQKFSAVIRYLESR